MTLCGIGTFFFVNLIQNQVFEEVPQVPFDVEGWLVTPDFPIHLPKW